MQNISNRCLGDAATGRFRAMLGMTLFVALALISERHLFAREKPTTYMVVMENISFSPNILHVHLGDRIEFTNHDLVPHTATAKPAGAFDSGPVKPGESWIFETKTAGTLEYACAFHPTMVGKLMIDESN